MDVGAERGEFRVNAPGSFHHHSSLGRGEAGGAFDESRSELLLKSRVMGRKVGLHGMERPSGGGEAPVIDHGEQGRELAEIHHK